MNKFQKILSSVRAHRGKPYSIRLSNGAVLALEYLLAQENGLMAESAGKRYLVDGKQRRVNGIQRTDIISRALLAELRRYHAAEHNGDEDEGHPAPELVGIVGADGKCPVCAALWDKI